MFFNSVVKNILEGTNKLVESKRYQGKHIQIRFVFSVVTTEILKLLIYFYQGRKREKDRQTSKLGRLIYLHVAEKYGKCEN